jgi:hypothetical protein
MITRVFASTPAEPVYPASWKAVSRTFASTAFREAWYSSTTWEAWCAPTVGYDKPVTEWLPSAASPFAAPE